MVIDGFVERENPNAEQFGVPRLKEVVRSARYQSPEKLWQSLYEAAVVFSRDIRQQDLLTP